MNLQQTNCYNNTQALISSLILKTLAAYDQEIERGTSQRQSIARAIGDTLNEHIKIIQSNYTVDREALIRANTEDSYFKHLQKAVFADMSDQIFKSEYLVKDTRDMVYQKVVSYEMALLDFSKIDSPRNTK